MTNEPLSPSEDGIGRLLGDMQLPAGFPVARGGVGPRERAQKAADQRAREIARQERSKLSGALPDIPFDIAVAGVSFRSPEFLETVGALWTKLQSGEDLPDVIGTTFIREPLNEHDPNAIAVWIMTDTVSDRIGYVPAPLARRLAPELDAEEVWLPALAKFEYNPKNPLAPLVTINVRRMEREEWEGLE